MRRLLLALSLVGFAFAADPATDTFTSPGSSPILNVYSTNWTPNTKNGSNEAYIIVFDNNVRLQGPSNYNILATWNADTFSANQYAQVTVSTAVGGGSNFGVVVRASATEGVSDGYRCSADDTGLLLARITDATAGVGIGSPAATFSASLVSGDVIRLEASGSTITCLLNGDPKIVATDTTYTTGRPGLGGYTADTATGLTYLDNFEAGSLSGGPPPSTSRKRVIITRK